MSDSCLDGLAQKKNSLMKSSFCTSVSTKLRWARENHGDYPHAISWLSISKMSLKLLIVTLHFLNPLSRTTLSLAISVSLSQLMTCFTEKRWKLPRLHTLLLPAFVFMIYFCSCYLEWTVSSKPRALFHFSFMFSPLSPVLFYLLILVTSASILEYHVLLPSSVEPMFPSNYCLFFCSIL